LAACDELAAHSRNHVILLEGHQLLLADRICQEAFREAVRRAVFPGATVLDLGTGTGIHALFACQAGARRVYAIDREAIIAVARSVARANGCGDRITFLHADVHDAELPEAVDVVIAHHDLEDLFELIPAARRRFLKPGGAVVPCSVELFAAAAEAPAAHERMVAFWTGRLGLDFSPVRAGAANTVYRWNLEPSEQLSEGVSLGSFEFQDAGARLAAERVVTVRRPGTLHGVGTWLIQRLIGDVTVSTGPSGALSPEVWKNRFFPLERPVGVHVGDVVTLELRTGAGGWGAVWQWKVEVRTPEGRVRSQASHSSFAGQLLSAEALRRQEPDYKPTLTPRGAAVRFVLNGLDEHHITRDIEGAVHREYPALFPTFDEAARFVTAVLARYAR
jgi:protein arginine N-methyltransferase 1